PSPRFLAESFLAALYNPFKAYERRVREKSGLRAFRRGILASPVRGSRRNSGQKRYARRLAAGSGENPATCGGSLAAMAARGQGLLQSTGIRASDSGCRPSAVESRVAGLPHRAAGSRTETLFSDRR